MKYFAFLRAINIGKRRVRMDKLKTLFDELGFENVCTYIASGNVIFESSNRDVYHLKTQIESELKTHLGFDVTTLIRTEEQLKDVVNNNPFEITNSDAQTIYVSFLSKEVQNSQYELLIEQQSDLYRFKLIGTELYTLRTLGQEESSVFSNNYIEKILKVSATTRNLNTVEKILYV